METLILESNIKLAQVTSNCHSKHLYNSSIISIGMYHENEIYRILFKIPINKIPKDAEIVAAKLKLNLITKRSKNKNIITPYALIKKWDLDTVTWNNQPDFSPKIFGESVNVKEDLQYVFDITNIVKKWHTYEIRNNGIVLKNQEINSSNSVKSIADIRKSYKPKVEIFYKLNFSCEPTLTSIKFINKIEKLDTNDSYSFSKIRNTSLTQTVMFFVKNLDICEIIAHIQVSPDGINFINEPAKILVGMNKIKFIVPCIFAKFTRIAVKNIHNGETSKVKIWYQAQK